jgi:hypothetical protein
MNIEKKGKAFSTRRRKKYSRLKNKKVKGHWTLSDIVA